MIKLKFVSSTRLEISTSDCQNVNIVHANMQTADYTWNAYCAIFQSARALPS